MKLKNLKINGFGKLQNKTIEFSEGINIISGKNEAGKSTLLKFITSMLYGISKKDLEKYKPWNTEEYSGKLLYKLDDDTEYEVYREFKRKSPIIYNSSKDDISAKFSIDKSKENLFFTEQTGITQENIFATSIAEQENIKISNNSKNSVIQKLSNLLTTGKENISYQKTIEKINKNQLEQIGNNRSTGRPINQIEEEIEKLEKTKKDIEIYKEKRYEIEEQKQTINFDLKDNYSILRLLRRQKVNMEKLQIAETQNKIFNRTLEETKQKQKRIEAQIKKIEENRKEKLKTNKLGYYCSILVILIITILSIFIIKNNYILALNTIPIVFITVYAINNQKQKNKIRKNGRKMYQEKTILEDELKQLEEEYQQKESENKQRQWQLAEEKRKNDEEITLEFINELDEETIRDILSTKYERIVEYIDEKEREKSEYNITEKKIEIDNENIIRKLEDLVEIDERLENLYEKRQELLNLNYIYQIIKEEIENSYQELKENITPNFLEELKNILTEVTNGRYQDIYLDSENNILVENEKGMYVPIENLSTGTIDLIYLALRISASKEISEENLPIILDESFAYYDTERMRRILKYLSLLNKYQIILFTCSNREIEILNNEKIQFNLIEL